MRIAVFGDIHGNVIGLDAVLDHIKQDGGADAYWLLGDYCFGGSDPVGVLERITTLPNAIYLSGNSDRYLTTPSLPSPVDVSRERLTWLIDVTRDQYWTIGALQQAGWMDWLRPLHFEYRTMTDNDIPVALMHSSSGTDENPGLLPTQTDDEVWDIYGEVEENLIFVGHTHALCERRINGKHIVNTGCIGKPVGTDIKATYALLETSGADYTVTLHAVEYDVEATIRHLDTHYPGADFMRPFYQGEVMPVWLQGR